MPASCYAQGQYAMPISRGAGKRAPVIDFMTGTVSNKDPRDGHRNSAKAPQRVPG